MRSSDVERLFLGNDPHFAAAHHTGYWDHVAAPVGLKALQRHFAGGGHHLTEHEGPALRTAVHAAMNEKDGDVDILHVPYEGSPEIHVTTTHKGRTKTSRIFLNRKLQRDMDTE